MKFGEAFVQIKADTSRLRADMGKAVGITRTGFGKITAMAAKAGAMIATYLGARALMGFARSAIDVAGQQVAAEIKLATALKETGNYTRENYQSLLEYAKSLQSVTMHGDETILTMMSLGTLLGGLGGAKLRQATEGAIGLAEALTQAGKPVTPETTMMLLARAAKGEFTLFTRYGISLAHLTTIEEKWLAVMKLANKGMKAHQDVARSMTGQIRQARMAYGDFKEQLGKGIWIGGRLGTTFTDLTRHIEGAGSAADRAGNKIGRMILWITLLAQTLRMQIGNALRSILWIADTVSIGVGNLLQTLARLPSDIAAPYVGRGISEKLIIKPLETFGEDMTKEAEVRRVKIEKKAIALQEAWAKTYLKIYGGKDAYEELMAGRGPLWERLLELSTETPAGEMLGIGEGAAGPTKRAKATMGTMASSALAGARGVGRRGAGFSLLSMGAPMVEPSSKQLQRKQLAVLNQIATNTKKPATARLE